MLFLIYKIFTWGKFEATSEVFKPYVSLMGASVHIFLSLLTLFQKFHLVRQLFNIFLQDSESSFDILHSLHSFLYLY